MSINPTSYIAIGSLIPNSGNQPRCSECDSDEFIGVELDEEDRAQNHSYLLCAECGSSFLFHIISREKLGLPLENLNSLRKHCNLLPIEAWKKRARDNLRDSVMEGMN